MEAQTESDINWALGKLIATNPRYLKYKRYYEGEHNLTFATDKFRNTFGYLFQAFSDNLCPTVVHSASDRLSIRGFTGKDAAPAEQLYAQRFMKRTIDDLIRKSLFMADEYVVVWPEIGTDGSEGPVRFWVNDPTTMTIRYDAERIGVIEVAAKLWRVGEGTGERYWRLNLYYADRIEKFITSNKRSDVPATSKSFIEYDRYSEAVDAEVNYESHELGRVPVVHFGNKAAPGEFGRSELEAAIPLQDALNKTVADMLVSQEFAAYRQRYATGVQVTPKYDEMGMPVAGGGNVAKAPFEPGPERLWVGATGVQFGEFDVADLRQFIEVADSFRVEMARVTDTPVHEMVQKTGEWPSGESLKTSEGKLVKKCKKASEGLGDGMRDACSMGIALDRNTKAEDLDITVNWDNFATREEKYEAETAVLKKQVGVSNQQIQRELGYQDDTIKKMAAEVEVDARNQASAVGAMFDRGSAAPIRVNTSTE